MVARTVQRASVVATDAVLIGSWANPGRHVATGQASYFGSGAKPEWPKPEAKGPRSGVVFGGGVGCPLPTSYGVWGSSVSSPSGVPLKGFLRSRGARWSLLELVGAISKAHDPLASPLNPPMGWLQILHRTRSLSSEQTQWPVNEPSAVFRWTVHTGDCRELQFASVQFMCCERGCKKTQAAAGCCC